MRVGDILLQHGWIDQDTLVLALADQPAFAGVRLCSLLVAQGSVSFDQASRALGEQFGTAAVLRRHLERRDRSLAALLPAEIARDCVALPIGYLGNGTLIVCVRDPSEELHAALADVLGENFVLAVAPARYVERLVEGAYAPRRDDAIELSEDELDEVRDDEPDKRDDEDELDESELDEVDELDAEVDDDAEPPASASGSDLSFEIDVADAEPADVDFTIDLEIPAEPEKRPSTSRALPVAIKPIAPAGTSAPTRDMLDETLSSLRDIDELEWLFDVVMKYVTSQWSASLLLALRGQRAVGVRGHGKRLKSAAVRTFIIEVADVTIVRLARDERRIVDELPDVLGDEHAQLVAALDTEASPVAAALVTGSAVSHVLVLGEPIARDREDALVDVGLLVEAMSDALSRM